jgi:hypothetical protein
MMRIVAPATYFEPPGHVHVYEREQFGQMFLDTGFEIERRVCWGFYHVLWWVLGLASGHCQYFPDPNVRLPEILADWERVWTALGKTPQAGPIMQRLDEIMPKSQIMIARKPAA